MHFWRRTGAPAAPAEKGVHVLPIVNVWGNISAIVLAMQVKFLRLFFWVCTRIKLGAREKIGKILGKLLRVPDEAALWSTEV